MTCRKNPKIARNPDPELVLRWLENIVRWRVGQLAEDSGFLPVELFVGEDAFVVQLFELPQLVEFVGSGSRTGLGADGRVGLLAGIAGVVIAGVVDRRRVVDDNGGPVVR